MRPKRAIVCSTAARSGLRDCQGVPTTQLDLRGRLREVVGIARQEHQAGPGLRQGDGSCPAQPTAGPRHDRDLARQRERLSLGHTTPALHVK
jgi:hypothetical protein